MKPEELRKGYVGWCPHTDYMTEDKEYPHSWTSCKKHTAEEFIKEWLPFDPEYNQIIDFFFVQMVPTTKCIRCEGSGYNAPTKRLSEDWYEHLRTDGKKGWNIRLEQDEVDVLVKEGRLMDFTRVPITPKQKEIVKKRIAEGHNSWLPFNNGHKTTAEEVNKRYAKGTGHDSINHGICVEVRAKRLGFWGFCETCKGEGYIVTDKEYLGLNLWMSHPRKGAARGVEIT
ncbi:unnamed protein product, partial [marine sediment metagenome]